MVQKFMAYCVRSINKTATHMTSDKYIRGSSDSGGWQQRPVEIVDDHDSDSDGCSRSKKGAVHEAGQAGEVSLEKLKVAQVSQISVHKAGGEL